MIATPTYRPYFSAWHTTCVHVRVRNHLTSALWRISGSSFGGMYTCSITAGNTIFRHLCQTWWFIKFYHFTWSRNSYCLDSPFSSIRTFVFIFQTSQVHHISWWVISCHHDCRVMAGTLTWTPVVGQGWLSNWEMQLHWSRLRSTWSTFFGILFVLSPHSGPLRCVLFHLSKYCTAFLPHRSEHVFDERAFFPLSPSYSHILFSLSLALI